MTETLLPMYIPSLATLVLVGIGILFNNARISDLNTNMNKRMDDLGGNLNRRMDDLNGRLDRLEQRQERLESVLVGKLSEVETRLAKIESHLNLR